jgi:hypothetical protein
MVRAVGGGPYYSMHGPPCMQGACVQRYIIVGWGSMAVLHVTYRIFECNRLP